MPWYRSGTANAVLNSTTIIGSGTKFAANGLVGDAFLGPDGRWYEVTNIASDTVLSILPAYQGTAVSAGNYALAPMEGYVRDTALQLRSIVNQFGIQLAALGTTGNYDVLPVTKGGTGGISAAAGLANLIAGAGAINENPPITIASAAMVPIGSAAANTINISGTTAITAFDSTVAGARRALVFSEALTLTHDATKLILPGAANIVTAAGDVVEVESLGGGNWKCMSYVRAAKSPDLVTSVGQGGTGVTSISALLASLNASGNYAKANIVGTVSQISGTPSGAIIETGNTANGRYMKYADGSLICTGVVPVSWTNTAPGSATWTFPVAFVNAAELRLFSSMPTGAPHQYASSIVASSSAGAAVYVGAFNGGAANPSFGVQVMAIGRWF